MIKGKRLNKLEDMFSTAASSTEDVVSEEEESGDEEEEDKKPKVRNWPQGIFYGIVIKWSVAIGV